MLSHSPADREARVAKNAKSQRRLLKHKQWAIVVRKIIYKNDAFLNIIVEVHFFVKLYLFVIDYLKFFLYNAFLPFRPL